MPRAGTLGAIRRFVLIGAALASLLGFAAPAGAAGLRAGAGRADITPPTGYVLFGWVRSDAVARGQHTRLFARALVLERDGRKVALVAEDMGGIPGGMVAAAAELVKDRGFNERNVLVSASHTHASPAGLYPFTAYNTVAPTRGTPTDFGVGSFDEQLYTFMVRRLAEAIRRADDNLAPAAAAWGETNLVGLTENRSIEAHLANHGIIREFGQGSAAEDPLGPAHTIDPEVKVLRVDKLVRRRRRPIGAWTTFSNHGTVNPYDFGYYNADHHGSATRVFEDKVRRIGRVPRRQDVVNAYGNTDEGDVSAALHHRGPAFADFVGRREARAMLAAWRAAGRRLSRTPELDLRWTRICFCGQATEGGDIDSKAVVGEPQLTGSEEGRGPLYDETQTPFEGHRAPVATGPQGHKVGWFTDNTGSFPKAVPLLALRVGDGVVVSVPGEMTAGMGHRVRAAALEAASGSGVSGVAISGLANEYLSYFTTPEEYDRQHYEGGSTLYGELSSNLLKLTLADLTRALVRGEPAATAYPFDPTNGQDAGGAPYEEGATGASVVAQPGRTRRLERAQFSWRGGERGFDRPLDRAFVTVQRRIGRRWRRVASDLGLQILWSVDDDGTYVAAWEVPLNAPRSLYRFRITANRYSLTSESFRVAPSIALELRAVSARNGRPAVALDYPEADPGRDITYRPRSARGGKVRFRVGSRTITVRRRRSQGFSVRARGGSPVRVPAFAAFDRFGNRNGEQLVLRP